MSVAHMIVRFREIRQGVRTVYRSCTRWWTPPCTSCVRTTTCGSRCLPCSSWCFALHVARCLLCRVMDAALQLMYKDNRVQLLKTAIDWKRTSSSGMEQVEPAASASAAEEAGEHSGAERAV
eukprot:scaffold343_cov23-Tisochrysis_lutea.AAC.2